MSNTPTTPMDHPELLVIKSTSSGAASSSSSAISTSVKTEINMKSNLRHPAMIPPSIQEENVSELYEIMPEPLQLESNTGVFSRTYLEKNVPFNLTIT